MDAGTAFRSGMTPDTLEALHAFSVLSHHTSLDAAAAELGIGRRTLSRRLSELETTLGFPLTTGQGKNRSLTDEGHCLLAVVEESWTILSRTLMRLGRQCGKGVVQVGVHPDVDRDVIESLFERFRARFPKADVVERPFKDFEQDDMLDGRLVPDGAGVLVLERRPGCEISPLLAGLEACLQGTHDEGRTGRIRLDSGYSPGTPRDD